MEHARERLLYLSIGDSGQGLNGLPDHAVVCNHCLQASFFLGKLMHEFSCLGNYTLVLVGQMSGNLRESSRCQFCVALCRAEGRGQREREDRE